MITRRQLLQQITNEAWTLRTEALSRLLTEALSDRFTMPRREWQRYLRIVTVLDATFGGRPIPIQHSNRF